MKRALTIGLVLAIGAFACTELAAHAIGLSRGEYLVTKEGVTAQLVFAHTELATSVAGMDIDADGRIGADELAQGQTLLEQFLLAGLRVQTGGNDCAGRMTAAALTENDGLQIALSFHCPAASADYRLQFGMIDALSPGHRHLANLQSTTGGVTEVLYQGQSGLTLAASGQAVPIAVGWPMVRLGIEHILTGYDHLVFLLGLLIVAVRWRDLLAVVTAFTLGHSVTLAVASIGLWTPGANWIEPLIALSIAYVGIENLWMREGARRWPLTMAFGLVHGFGFAGVLREIEVPAAQLPLALLSFNGGVEFGQLLVLALVLPAIFLLRQRHWYQQQGIRALSVVIALAGAGWFVERVS